MSKRRKEEEIFVNNYKPLSPSDFYTESRLQDALSRPTEYVNNAEMKKFDMIYYDLHKKNWTTLWNTIKQLLRTHLTILTGKRQTI